MPNPTTIPASREEIAAHLCQFLNSGPPATEASYRTTLEVIRLDPGGFACWLKMAPMVESWLSAAREQGRSEGLEEAAAELQSAREELSYAEDEAEAEKTDRHAAEGALDRITDALGLPANLVANLDSSDVNRRWADLAVAEIARLKSLAALCRLEGLEEARKAQGRDGA